ncbi:hypothetical protein HNQ07_001484 [Deinococcus metalli]|uniref:Uncharacterized protein n=1 Tax=Deinococcus metalli TaxID=1141878 RepID=A0A7W8NRD7_9DEIO|nr:hypothetical protein [Deinococcus metalli]MBB5376027.1 hypothetical protein [Deinococcus metalli]GHF41366.1 hypothetical protein GCM10017781_17560 [Deinococcus metalli]
MTADQPSRPDKGVRGFELDIHVTFARPLPREHAAAAVGVLDGLRVELYAPHASPTRALTGGEDGTTDAPVPSARLTGPLGDPDSVRAGLGALLSADARYVEVGVRGFLRGADGRTEWMPWRRNAVLPRGDAARVAFEPGVKYVLE